MHNILNIVLVLGGTALLAWPLGKYLASVMDPGSRLRVLHAHIERMMGAVAGSTGRQPQDWMGYLVAMITFNVLMFVLVCILLGTQQFLPLNPASKGPLSWDLVFNTAASFTTNTNLQHYSGEVSMSYFSQVFALMWLQFVSTGTGLACLAALARGLAGSRMLGNFFLDLQRAVFLVLLPLALLVAALFVAGGMPMTFHGAVEARTLEGAVQTIARGPVAAFVAIKQLGTNGGGFYGPNSTHPFENPGFFTNIVSMIAILLIPMACVWMFGRITGRPRHAIVIFGVMFVLLACKASWAVWAETTPAAALHGLPVVEASSLEGKELRLGSTTGPLWAALTTCTSNGSVGAMHDSLNPLTSLSPFAGMWLNATFGGVGVGMINMFGYIIVAVFLGGMMIGRTPEYFGRRIDARETGLAALMLLFHPLFILVGAALFSISSWGTDTIANPGPHGFSEILYEFSSAAANNGSGFEGLGDNTVPWNIATGLIMLLGRYLPIILPLAIVGLLAAKPPVAESSGTLRVDAPTFGILLLGVIVLFGALTFLPAAMLGPVAEHLMTLH
ncbi:MAG: potassium-transporting ATPase subunit A [Chthoniobacterales bacterium]|nr:potassium-transporting ATPase subunit A [Chthoniobacterales bacterium]